MPFLESKVEVNDIVTLENVINAIQRAEMVMKIVEEIKKEYLELKKYKNAEK